MTGFRGDFANCCTVTAGAPATRTERRNRMSDRPDLVVRADCSLIPPVTSAHEYGSAARAWRSCRTG